MLYKLPSAMAFIAFGLFFSDMALADKRPRAKNSRLRHSESDDTGAVGNGAKRRRRTTLSVNDNSSSLHKEQDGAIGRYEAMVSASATFLSKSSTPEMDGVKGETSSSSKLELDLNYLFRMDSLFLGPLIGYSMSKSEFLGEDRTTSTIDVGAIADLTLSDVDKDQIVPHIYAGARYNTEVFEGSDDSASGYRLGAGGGIYYFLASNIAVDFKAEYQYQSLSVDEASLNSSIVSFGFGLAAFLD